MRKAPLLFAAVLLFCAGCRARTLPAQTGTSVEPTAALETAGTSAAAEPSAPPSEPSVSAEPSAEPSASETAAGQPPETEPAPAETASAAGETEIDLSIALPQANGTMQVGLSPDDPYIRIVHEQRGIDASLLASVFTVPQNGQNYVFEFTGDVRTAETIRRVYLIDASGAIVSVAAADSSERENVSAAENWFCMNVLIRGVVFPAVQNEISS